MSQVVGTLEIQLMANVARLQSDMAAMKASVGSATSAIESMAAKARAALGGIGVAVGLQGLVAMTDQYTKFTAQLQMASNSAAGYAKSLEDVRRISAAAQSDLQMTGTLYARISKATEELGVSQKRVSNITEVVALALKASGASTSEAASATLQLSQAFGSGVLRGEEFNAVNEASPRLMKALADGMGVPVGQLRNMATEGKLTAEVMAVALPKALETLRIEAAKVQTIAGSFQVLKNNAMELIGTAAQGGGAIQVLTGAIGLLANNLTLILGISVSLAATKVVSWAVDGAAAMYAQVAASRAAAAATLTKAQADAAATASSVALTTARVAELRSAVTAASGDVALAVATNGLIPAHARAAAAAEAHTVALAALSVAQRGASVSAGIAGGAMALLVGPVGAIVTVLGLAATAWALWGNSAKDANDKAAAAIGASGAEINATLDSQILKLQQRIALANGGELKLAKDGGETAELQAKRLAEINALKAKGNALTLAEMPYLYEIQGQYDATAEKVRQVASETAKLSAIGEKSKAAEWAEKYATKTQQMTKELEAYKLAVGAAYDPKIEAQIRDRYKETAKAATVEEKAFAKFAADAAKREALLNAESDAEKSLTETQKWALEVMVLVRDGKLGESDAERKLIGEIVASQLARESLTRAEKEAEDQRKEHTAAMLAEIDAQAAVAKGITDSNKSLREQTAEIGLTADALAALKLARVDDAIAIEQARLAGMASASQNSVEANAIRETIAALEDRKAAMQENDKAQKAADAIKKQGEAWKSIEDTAHKTFVSIFDSGKSAFDRLRDTLKNGLLDLLYQMTVKKWIFSIAAGVSGTASAESAFGSAAGGSSSGAGSMLSGAKSAYDLYNGGAASMYQSFAGSGIGSAIGLSTPTVAGTAASAYSAGGSIVSGNAVGSTVTAAGMSASSVIPIIGWIIAGAMANNSYYDQGYTLKNQDSLTNFTTGFLTGTASPIVTTQLEKMGLSSKMASMLTGNAVENKLFGYANKEVKATGVQGIFSGSGFSGQNYADWSQKGGWFRSDKSGTDRQAITGEADAGFDSIVTATKASFDGLFKAMGEAPRSIDAWAFAIHGSLATQDEMNAMVKSLADSMALTLVPEFVALQKSGEALSDTVIRMQNEFVTTDRVVTMLGLSATAFGAVGIASAAARDRLVTAAGGIEALSNGVSTYYAAYYSEAEKTKLANSDLAKSFAGLGLAVPASKEALKGVVKGLDLTTASGAATFAALMVLAPAFATVADAATAAAAAIASERSGLQSKLDTALGNTVALRAKELAAIDASNRALQERIWAIEDSKAALSSAYSALDASVSAQKTALQTTLASDKAGISARLNAQLAANAAQAAAAQVAADKIRSIASALSGAVKSIVVDDPAYTWDRLSQARGTIAGAQGVTDLSSVPGLEEAIGIASGDSKLFYSTFEEYARDQLTTAWLVGNLDSKARAQITWQEAIVKAVDGSGKSMQAAADAQLAALDSQYAQAAGALDATLAKEQEQINAIYGVNTSVLSISDAMRALTASLAAASIATGKDTVATPVAAVDLGTKGQWTAAATTVQADAVGQYVADQYKAILGRTADAEGLAYWTAQLKTGAVAMGDFAKTLLTAAKSLIADPAYLAQYTSIFGAPKFAAGGSFGGGLRWVGENGPELEATGPSRIFNSGQIRDVMRGGANNSSNNTDRLEALVEALTEKVAALLSSSERTAANTSAQESFFRRISPDGESIKVSATE